MTDLLPFLKSLISASGLSGYESLVARLIEEKWRPLVDELNLSRLGSVHGLRRGIHVEPRPSIIIPASRDDHELVGMVDNNGRVVDAR